MGDVSISTALSDSQILKLWDTVADFDKREQIMKQMKDRNLFPSETTATWEHEAGLYPDSDDPRFIESLMEKQEFIENRQESLKDAQKRGKDLCNTDQEFELSPVQRFVSRFLSPKCPYQSALLYHGVGVGKTCAAIVTAEEYLRSYPKETVFIVAPRNIQPGFRRTIFDEETLVISKSRTIANTANGCTGNSYLKRTGTEYEIDKQTIVRRINQSISTRYKIFGYLQFSRFIQEIIDSAQKTGDDERTRQEQVKALRRAFDGRFVIIDEAHNLRDAPGETDDDNRDAAGGDVEVSESKAGKRLTPVIVRMLRVVQGMKLMLLTGTPMYNSYREIIFLLKLLLLNDKKGVLSERDVFGPSGNFRENGEKRLGGVATAYLSFMRGENPLTFPVRLSPLNTPTLTAWPSKSPKGVALPSDEKSVSFRAKALLKMPFIPVAFEEAGNRTIREIANNVLEEEAGGLSIGSLDEMVQSGNWLFPGIGEGVDNESRIRDTGFRNVFEESKDGKKYTSKLDIAWLAKGALKAASPKADFVINRVGKSKGVVFIYSRFIRSGALPMALALEANGYSPWADGIPLLANQQVRNRQCSQCDARERSHTGKSHPFAPAYYVLLTGQAALSPNNAAAIKASRGNDNLNGKNIKVIVGSQVASEGIDLRFIREIYVFDSWFHLNKLEQVLGRGIRTCSHSLLPAAQRNCTIYLLVNTYSDDADTETADMYMYRKAMDKAVQIGRVTRVLKQYALDCNLNISANYVSDLEPIERLEDSQGEIRENVNINDTEYTSICDWMECSYTCAKPVDLKAIIDSGKIDMSTYDEYAMRWRETQMKQLLKKIFQTEEAPNVQAGALEDTLHRAGIPTIAIKILLSNIVGNRSFRIQYAGQEGYILYRNGFYLFQPIRLADVRIPLALRVADVPVGRDEFTPIEVKYVSPGAAPVATKDSTQTDITATVVTAPTQAPSVNTALPYWKSCVAWANQIKTGERILDIPPECMKNINARYKGELFKREFNVLTMISWMYENIHNSTEYTEENRVKYRTVLANIFLEIIWDESISPAEQLKIIETPANLTDELKAVITEQKMQQGSTSVYRYIDAFTGKIEYICGKDKCSQAVVRLLDTDAADPLNKLEANRDTTGPIYGFIIPKIKEGKYVLKTNDRPVSKGVVPEKGKECENVSNFAGHKEQLQQIGEMLKTLGYPPFLLVDTVLNEKELRVKGEAGKLEKKDEAEVAQANREMQRVKDKLIKDFRRFQNVIKACALKNIILRMLDKMESEAGRKRYFYRPIAAIKTKHKLK